MGEAIGQVPACGVGVALSPVPITAVVLMLATPHARVNGPAFLGGWILGLAVVGAIGPLVAGGAGASDHGRPATWVSIAKLVLGALLVLVAARQWRHRPRAGAERAALPQWMRTIDTFTLRYAGSRSRRALRLLVLHDDPEREFAHTAGAEQALERAQAQRWTVISVRDDWAKVFAEPDGQGT